MNNKYALVFSGGGANGAYQIGVWKALKKLKIKIIAVFGNSVGALNGALFLMNKLNLAIKLWENITLNNIINIEEKKLNKLTPLALIKFIHLIIKNGGMDTDPLKKLFEQYLDEKKIRKRKIDFGLISFSLNDFKPIEIFLEEIPEGSLKDYLLASASIPLLFKPKVIQGKLYVDGGIYDNIPFSLAKRRGYKNIIVVDISGLGINRKPEVENTQTIYIKNSLPLGENILDFDPEKAKRFIELGYLDTMKVFGRFQGINYFLKIKKSLLKKLEKILYSEQINIELTKVLPDFLCKNNEEKIKWIRENLPPIYSKNKDLIISLIECAALSLDIKRDFVYKNNEILKRIWEKYLQIEDKTKNINFNSFMDSIFKRLFSITSLNDLSKIFKRSSLEYEKGLELFFKLKEWAEASKIIKKILYAIFPYLVGAKVFFAILNIYFKKIKA